jgi:uncharacterized membrane protein (DUF106 family)
MTVLGFPELLTLCFAGGVLLFIVVAIIFTITGWNDTQHDRHDRLQDAFDEIQRNVEAAQHARIVEKLSTMREEIDTITKEVNDLVENLAKATSDAQPKS